MIDFADKSENIPKGLERIGMRESFKNLFFGQSRGNKVTFHGSQIGIPRNEECRLLLEELDEIHRKAGCPKDLKLSLPTIEQIEEKLAKDKSDGTKNKNALSTSSRRFLISTSKEFYGSYYP